MEYSSPEGRYANVFHVGFNAFEFVLDFGQTYSERREGQVHSRVVTSPVYASLLLSTLRESLARYEEVYGHEPKAWRLGGWSHIDRECVIQEAMMPESKQPYGAGVNEVGLPETGTGGEADALSLGDLGEVFNKVKGWIIDNDDKVIQVVLPWLKKVVSSRLGVEGADPYELPNTTSITAMIPPGLVVRMSPAVKKLTRGDLLALGGWGVPRKLPSELGLSAKDIQTIRDLFTQGLTNPSSFAEADAWSISCCSCTPCCCAAAVLTPLRKVS